MELNLCLNSLIKGRNFTTLFVANKLDRIPVGFEINKKAFEHHMPLLKWQAESQMYPMT